MNIDKYLYEIIDDYKTADSEEEKAEIFKDFCSSIWSSKNKRRVYTKTIKFRVINDLLNTLEEEDYNAAIRYIEFLSASRKQEKAKKSRNAIGLVAGLVKAVPLVIANFI